jgi:hypothetical protein
MYVYGGYDGSKCRDNLYVLEIGTAIIIVVVIIIVIIILTQPSSRAEAYEWRKAKATGQKPPRLAGHSAALVGDRMYIFGGRSSNREYLNTLYVLDLRTSPPPNSPPIPHLITVPSPEMLVWHRVEGKGDLPGPRAFHTMVADDTGSSLFVYGGCNQHEIPNGDLFRFDLGIVPPQLIAPKC